MLNTVGVRSIITPNIIEISGPTGLNKKIELINRLISHVEKNPNTEVDQPKKALIITSVGDMYTIISLTYRLVQLDRAGRETFNITHPIITDETTSYEAAETVVNFFLNVGYQVHFLPLTDGLDSTRDMIEETVAYIDENELTLDWIGIDKPGRHEHETEVLIELHHRIPNIVYTTHVVPENNHLRVLQIEPTVTEISGSPGEAKTVILLSELIEFVENNPNYDDELKNILLISAHDDVDIILKGIYLLEGREKVNREDLRKFTDRVKTDSASSSEIMSYVLSYFNQHGYEFDTVRVSPTRDDGKVTEEQLSEYINSPIAWLGLDFPSGLDYPNHNLTRIRDKTERLVFTRDVYSYLPHNKQLGHIQRMEEKERALNLQDGDVYYIQFDGEWHVGQWDAGQQGWMGFEEPGDFENTSIGSTFEASCDLDDIGERVPSQEELKCLRKILRLAEEQAAIINQVKDARHGVETAAPTAAEFLTRPQGDLNFAMMLKRNPDDYDTHM